MMVQFSSLIVNRNTSCVPRYDAPHFRGAVLPCLASARKTADEPSWWENQRMARLEVLRPTLRPVE